MENATSVLLESLVRIACPAIALMGLAMRVLAEMAFAIVMKVGRERRAVNVHPTIMVRLARLAIVSTEHVLMG